MVGIVSYGGYIPYYRLPRIEIAKAWMGQIAPQPGEKAVANFDEDSVTMAVAAASDCLNGLDRTKIDGLYMATTTSPYQERHGAGIISAALDLRRDIRTGDFANSIRGATIALNAAFDTIKAGAAKNMLVTAADCRVGATASTAEMSFGDGAASLLLGEDNIIATLEASYTISEDFMDVWKTDREGMIRTWEDRWIRDEGYSKFVPQAISGVLSKCNIGIQDVAKVAFYSPFPGYHNAMMRSLKLDPAQVQDSLFTTAGNTATALPLMQLVAALEDAKPGDRILVAGYGNGSDALLFKVTEEIEKVRNRRGIKGHLGIKGITTYEKSIRWRNMVPVEAGGRAEGELRHISPSALWRYRKAVLPLCGSQCNQCGTPDYPPQRVCNKCQAVDDFKEYRFSDKKAKVFSFTNDLLAFSIDPPATVAVVNFEGGGRGTFDMTDRDPNEVKPDMPVEMTFRKIQFTKGIHNYGWKVKPLR